MSELNRIRALEGVIADALLLVSRIRNDQVVSPELKTELGRVIELLLDGTAPLDSGDPAEFNAARSH